MSLEKISSLIWQRNAMIFAQPPDPATGFVPLLLSQVSVPSPTRVALNLTTKETVQRRWRMTRNPIERITAQNRIQDPKSVTITGMLSADPVFSLLQNVGVARLDRLELTKLIKIVELSTCFLVTPERAYPNMGCLVLDENYDDETGRGVDLMLRFEEFAIARPGLIEGEIDLAALDVGALSAVDMGSTTPQPVPDLGGLV